MWCINTSIELSIILFDIPFSTFYAVLQYYYNNITKIQSPTTGNQGL